MVNPCAVANSEIHGADSWSRQRVLDNARAARQKQMIWTTSGRIRKPKKISLQSFLKLRIWESALILTCLSSAGATR